MATFQHPASLNAFQQFRQACSILRGTTRATNAGWYQDALELGFQLHIRTDGATVAAYFFDSKKNHWHAGPTLTDEVFGDSARTETLIAEALRVARSHGATALGVVLHIADEFATTELKPDLDNPAALPELREAAVSTPGAILEDSSIQADQSSWRVLPYPAAGSDVIGTTVTLTRQFGGFFAAIRAFSESQNFPIVTHALSAPLIAAMGLGQAIKPTPGRPFVAILQYPWLTVLAFFNEHSDLRLFRTLQHRGVRRPTNFRSALATTNASLEFVDPDLFLVPLGAAVDNALDADLKITFTTSRVEVVRLVQIPEVPGWCPEPVIAAVPPDSGNQASSHTFTILREEKWALQDFLPTPKEIVEIYPNRAEMRLLRISRLAKVGILAIAILGLAYTAFGIINVVRQPEWAFDPSEAGAVKSKLLKLTGDRKKADHWNNLLEDRSKAWTTMESLARLFPDSSGMLAKTFSYSAKPDSTPGQAKVGFIKEWKITGFARDEALDYINTLNTREGISAHFSDVSKHTGSAAYNPSVGNRNLVVNVRTQENSAFKPVPPEETTVADESTYPFTFDLTITQRFEATDPMAINVAKSP